MKPGSFRLGQKSWDPALFINLETYPILDRGAKFDALVKKCQDDLAASGSCALPGFLTPEATKLLADEARELAPTAFHKAVEGNAYLQPIPPGLPSDDPRTMVETTDLGAVAYDQFPLSSPLRHSYEWEPTMKFLAAVLKKPKLYRYADPMGALNLAVMKEGDYLRWHFDQSDFVTSIALQASESGGDFESVCRLRSKTDERYAKVRGLLKGSREGVQTLPMVPGTLVLFEGRYSIHRVTPIVGKTQRLVALLSYDENPGVDSTDHLKMMRYGRTTPYTPK